MNQKANTTPLLVSFKDAVSEAYSRTTSAGLSHDIKHSDLDDITNHLISEFIKRTNFYKETEQGRVTYVSDLITVPMGSFIYEAFDATSAYTDVGKILLVLHLNKQNNNTQFLVTYAENLKYCWLKQVLQLLEEHPIVTASHAHFTLKNMVGRSSQLYVFYVQSHRRETKWQTQNL